MTCPIMKLCHPVKELKAFCQTAQADEKSFCGFSYLQGMQNLSVMESLEVEFQILSTLMHLSKVEIKLSPIED